MTLQRVTIVMLVTLDELPRYLADGWQAAMQPWHPVSRHYGKIYIWKGHRNDQE